MSATRSISVPVKRFQADQSEGALSQEEYNAKWAAFARFMEKTPVGSTKRVKGRVTRVFGPVPIADVYQGKGKIRENFLLDCLVKHKGLEGITFNNTEVANSFNEKAKFNHLFYAVTGEAPDGESMDIHPAIVCTRDVWFVVKKGKKRPDEKRGGYYFSVTEYQPLEDEDGNLGTQDDLRDEDWVEATPEQWNEYQTLADLSMREGKRVRRLPGSAGSYQPAGVGTSAEAPAIVQPAQRPAATEEAPFDNDEFDEE